MPPDTAASRQPPAGPQHVPGLCQFMGRRTGIDLRIMRHQILEMDKLAAQGEIGAGLAEFRPRQKAVPNGASPHALVKPGNGVLGLAQPVDQNRPGRPAAGIGTTGGIGAAPDFCELEDRGASV